MASPICIICGTKFESERASKLCCSIECEKIRKAEYDAQRYIEFRNADRKRRREMLAEKYSIDSTNLYKLKSVCDDCLTEFYHDYSIYQKFNDAYVSHFNATEWGAAVCPHCGLVEKSKYDDEIKQFTTMTDVEQKLFFTELRKCKSPPVRHYAIYLRNQLDFIAEAEDIRKRLNRITNKGELTSNEIRICISALFRSLQ